MKYLMIIATAILLTTTIANARTAERRPIESSREECASGRGADDCENEYIMKPCTAASPYSDCAGNQFHLILRRTQK